MTSKRKHKRTPKRHTHQGKARGNQQHTTELTVTMPFAPGETHAGRCMKLVSHPALTDAVCYRMAGHEERDDLGCNSDIDVGSFIDALRPPKEDP